MVSSHVSPQMLAWAEQRLSPAERARVEAHLAECGRCRAEADDLRHLADTLGALPAALRILPVNRARAWPAVWARVQGSALPRALPRLSVYLSLVGLVFVVAVALPASLGGQPMPVTAGVIQTPLAPQGTAAALSASATLPGGTLMASDAEAATAARPIAVPTPIPGPKG